MKLTEKQYQALKIIEEAGWEGIRATEFAQKMWPGHNMHYKVSNQGNGATHGKAAWLCGGGFIGRLKKKGLVTTHFQNIAFNVITREGRQAIKTHESAKGYDYYDIEDIWTNHNGAPQSKEHQRLIRDKLRENPCKVCNAKEGEDCTGVKGVHLGRLPEGWDSLIFIVDHMNGFQYEPGKRKTPRRV